MPTTESNFKRAADLRQRSQFKAAAAVYRHLAKRCTGRERCEALHGLADCARLLGEFKISVKAYKAAIKLSMLHAPGSSPDLLAGLALALRASGRPFEAKKRLASLLKFYSRHRDVEGQAFAHWALGGTLRLTGEMPLALRHLIQASRLYQRLGDAEGVSYCDCALGGVNRMLGRWKESAACYARANRRMRARRDAFGIAYSFCGRGNALRMQGRYKQALLLFRRAEKDYSRIGDRVSYAYTLWSMAMARKMLGQRSAARQDLNRADAFFIATGDSRGHAYAELGRLELAVLGGRSLKRKFARKLGQALVRQFARRALQAAKGYPWESAHVRTLLKPELVRKTYSKLGSKFRHLGAPVNWP